MKDVFLDSQTVKPEALNLDALRALLPHWTFHGRSEPG